MKPTVPINQKDSWQLRYWFIFTGQALSLIGSAMTQFVLLWWITDTTGSVKALAIAGTASLLPQALLAPLGGTLADRYNRRIIMITADLVSAACMLVLIYLFLSEQVVLTHLYLLLAVRSAMQAFQSPAMSASTALLVPKDFLPRAAGFNQTLIGLMTIAAAPMGAFAISILPIGWALSIDVITAILGVCPLLYFSIPQIYEEKKANTNMWKEFKEGVNLVWKHPGLRNLHFLLGAVVLVIMPSFTLVPLLVKEHFGRGAPSVALLEGLSGAGMILGGLITAALAPHKQIVWFLTGFSISCFSLALTALTPPEFFSVAILFWTISGTAFIMGNAPLTALLQSIIPNEIQGRVLSLMSSIMGLAAPLGLLITIPLGNFLGVRWLFVLIGTLSGIFCLIGFMSPTLRSLSSRDRINITKD